MYLLDIQSGGVMFLRLYIVVSSLALVVLTTAAFRQAGQRGNLGEITVERINVVDANGTLRLVIANKDRMHPGVMDGKVICPWHAWAWDPRTGRAGHSAEAGLAVYPLTVEGEEVFIQLPG